VQINSKICLSLGEVDCIPALCTRLSFNYVFKLRKGVGVFLGYTSVPFVPVELILYFYYWYFKVLGDKRSVLYLSAF